MKLFSPVVQVNINRGLKNWFCNMFRFYYQRTIGNVLIKRDPKLWVFSAWEGTKYADNAKYLFEYINENDKKGIRCVWITKNRIALSEVLKKGYEGYLVGSKEGKDVQKHAGVALRTHGLDDFGDFPYIFGAFNLHVCHGVSGNKKTYYGMNKGGIKRILSVVKAKIFNYAYRDATIVTSHFCAKTVSIDMLSNKETPIIGLARNDFINDSINDLQEVFSKEFINRHRLEVGMKYITYMPTYRPLLNSQKQLEKTIFDIVNNEQLNDMLNELNVKFVIKLHYATDASKMSFSDNVLLLKDSDVSDTAKLLRLSSLLITDYSSCAMDFSLKQKGVIFYAPDLEEYEQETGMYQEFLDYLYKYRICTIEELSNRIKNFLENEDAVPEETLELNRLFNERGSEVGEFRKLIYEYVCQKMNI